MAPNNEELEKKLNELTEKVGKHGEKIARIESQPEPASADDIARDVESRVKAKGGGINLMGILFNAVVAAVVVFVMINFMGLAITPGWFNENIAPTLNQLNDTYATKGELDNYVSKGEEGDYALKSDLGGYALKSELPSEPDLSGYVTAEQYDAVLARVAALEIIEEEGATPVPTGAVTASIKTQFFEYVVFPAEVTDDTDDPPDGEGDGPWNEISVPLRLTLTNNTGSDVVDISVAVSFTPYYTYQDITWDTDYPKMGGGVTLWTNYGISSYGMVFVNGWGLSLDAGETKTIDLALLLKAAADHNEVRWTPDVSVEDFEYE